MNNNLYIRHAEISQEFKHMLPIVNEKTSNENKSIILKAISVLDKAKFEEEIGRGKLTQRDKARIIKAIEGGQVKVYVLNDENKKHLDIIDEKHILVQAIHKTGEPKDMIYVEDNPEFAKKYIIDFFDSIENSEEINKDDLIKLFKD